MPSGAGKSSKKSRGNGLTVAGLCDAMEKIAPTWTAAEWDNVGLLAGSTAWPLARAMLAIDLTADVLDEAIRGRCDAIVAYHPPVFRAVKRLRVDRGTPEGLAAEAIANRIAVYSPHTALDAAPGGTNDTLAELAGIADPVAFASAVSPASRCKLVVFVPSEQLEKVAAAVFDAGGGRIGDYTHCSYRLAGEGTFFGTDATNPAVGNRGRIERVAEIRLEVIFDKNWLADVIAAVRRSHPYEEPAFDVYPLEPLPAGPHGQGRMGALKKPIRLAALAKSITKKIDAPETTLVGKSSETIRRGFVCVGAAGSLPFEIPGVKLGRGDVVITGEIRHHDALRYNRAGACAIALGHWASERPALRLLAERLRDALPGVSFVVSRNDRNPFSVDGRS